MIAASEDQQNPPSDVKRSDATSARSGVGATGKSCTRICIDSLHLSLFSTIKRKRVMRSDDAQHAAAGSAAKGTCVVESKDFAREKSGRGSGKLQYLTISDYSSINAEPLLAAKRKRNEVDRLLDRLHPGELSYRRRDAAGVEHL